MDYCESKLEKQTYKRIFLEELHMGLTTYLSRGEEARKMEVKNHDANFARKYNKTFPRFETDRNV